MSVMLLVLQLMALAAVLQCAELHAEECKGEVESGHDESWPTAVKLPSNKVIYLPPRGRGEGSSNHSIIAEYSLPSSSEIDSGFEHFSSPVNSSDLIKLKTVHPQKYGSRFEDEWTPQGAFCDVSTALIEHSLPEQKSNCSELPANFGQVYNAS
ncbi:Hypothetical protein NTJ_05709 [Nesidiocoris tenuis]|uniref:Uncharacterized protein n=1 Tax=Nesidiocoris tenuis TaxID=355587 RepID=A0ABN7AL04_9HEMI|nr:Hypothetical protein NTJ_05709 [Nesidiocoris tenuis]